MDLFHFIETLFHSFDDGWFLSKDVESKSLIPPQHCDSQDSNSGQNENDRAKKLQFRLNKNDAVTNVRTNPTSREPPAGAVSPFSE